MDPSFDPAFEPETAAAPLAARLAARAFGARKALLRGLADLVLPPVCMACRTAVDEPGCLCAGCWSRIDFIAPPICDRLGTPLVHAFDGGSVSAARSPIRRPMGVRGRWPRSAMSRAISFTR